ncbi:MAG: phosphoglucosamine mutase [Elusimicrobiota bacterium]
MKPLKISVSGIRGIAGETLTPEIVVKFAQAFGSYVESGKVIVGRDTRVSGDMVLYSTMSGLISSGCEVTSLGIVPTPTVQLAVKQSNADGGIAVTASHNSADWNALIFVRNDGMFLNTYQGEELMDIYHEESFEKASWDKLKKVRDDGTAIDKHIETVTNYFDVEKIRAKRFRVAVDLCNGAPVFMTPKLLDLLGCTVSTINGEPTGIFARDPEPSVNNLNQLCSVMKSGKVDIGFAHDADGDRLAVVDENGVPLGEEYTVALAIKYWLEYKEKGLVVTNLSTTRAVDDIAKSYGVPVIRTKVGDVNVTETLKNSNGVIGGEGNGGVAIPKIHYAQDSFAAMTLILQFMAETGLKVSELMKNLPRYYMTKKKVDCPPDKIYAILDEVRELYHNETVDCLDGIKIIRADEWLHIRASGTEPIIRFIAEAKDQARAERIVNDSIRQIRKYL